ncbi:MAG: AIPR family protein [Nannocystis sp.]|uniref:AIPR family protein n=1 Tax=Nannocystis sp. TaxID=1962667 RepID=UPI002427E393|nr:AIPR family protein [Nannocystis sp.]MBK9756752.1 AIPR family protein [Nannocystis sp.]
MVAKKTTTRTQSPRRSQKPSAKPILPQVDINAALKARTDLAKYGPNARSLFALELRFDLEDIHTVAAESLTDGYDDKKCDLLYVDRDGGLAVIVQGYESIKQRKEAKANKAADLNTAASWVLGRDVTDLPQALQSAARELQDALDDGEISKVYLWFVHNAEESDNVARELKTARATAQKILRSERKWKKVDVEAIEVGLKKQAEWYASRNSTIKVDGEIELGIQNGYEISAPDAAWKAFVTTVPLTWLWQMFQEHKDVLFSANVRNYLGIINSAKDINMGIRKTAESAPGNFWAYNNGLTVLVRSYTYDENAKLLRINGLSIVNGAQTTGVIGNMEEPPNAGAMAQARFVATSKHDIIHDIIKYNNSQNKVKSSDFRSDDAVQRALRSQFEQQYETIRYLGGRRGGDTDAKARHRDVLASDTVAQALTAFHGHPLRAYTNKGKIWEDNKYYEQVFNSHTTAAHVLFVFSLLRCIEELKERLAKAGEKGRTTLQADVHNLFQERGATYLAVSAFGVSVDELAGKRVADRFDVAFKKISTIDDAIAAWRPVVDVAISAMSNLHPAAEKRLRGEGVVEDSNKKFLGFLSVLKGVNPKVFSDFARQINA